MTWMIPSMIFDGVSEPLSEYNLGDDYEHEHRDAEHEHEEEPEPSDADEGLAMQTKASNDRF